jgi:AraC-like DNA-binding protein
MTGIEAPVSGNERADSPPAVIRRAAVYTPFSSGWAVPNVAYWLESRLASSVISYFPPAQRIESVAELRSTIARSNVNLVIADPALTPRIADALCSVRAEFPSVLVVVYTSLTPAVVADLLRLAAAGIDEVMLFGTDDTKSRFAELGVRSLATAAVLQAERILAERLKRLPEPIRCAVVAMLYSPRRFRTVDDLSAAAFVTRRTLYRQLTAAGFESPRLLLLSGRVLRAISMLRDPSRNLRQVAAALGYSKPDRLSDHVAFFTGLRPRELRGQVSLTEIVVRLVGRL